MSNKKTLTVSILGRNYSLLTDEDSKIVEDAAELIDSMSKSMAVSLGSPAEAAKKTTFIALKIAVDLLKERRELKAVGNKTSMLNDLLKESLA